MSESTNPREEKKPATAIPKKGKGTLALEGLESIRQEKESHAKERDNTVQLAKWAAIKAILTSPNGKWLVFATALILVVLIMVSGATFAGVGFHASKDGTITFGMPSAVEPSKPAG